MRRSCGYALGLVGIAGGMVVACVGAEAVTVDAGPAIDAAVVVPVDAAPDVTVIADATTDTSAPIADAGSDADAAIAPFRVFVSSITFDGAPGDLGGRTTMDNLCNGMGRSLLGSRTWLAYIVDPQVDAMKHPAERFADVPGGWYLPNGTFQVVASKAVLVTGQLLRAIVMTETRAVLASGDQDFVWTGMNGNLPSAQHCGRWMNGTFNAQGRVGLAQRATNEWQSAGDDGCNQKRRIYCFEQP